MPSLVTPGFWAGKSELFHHLAQLTSSGIGVIQAVDLQRRAPPRRAMATELDGILRGLNEGHSVSTAFAVAPRWISPLDVALLRASELSGRLPDAFSILARTYQERAELLRSFLRSVAYPALLVHMAVVIFPIGALQGLVLRGEFLSFLGQKILILLPLYALILGAWYLLQDDRPSAWRATVERLLQALPGLGAAQRHLALSRLCLALESLISAGAPIIESWEIASRASGSPRLLAAVQRFKPRLETGELPSEAVRRCGLFPDTFVNQYTTGETSGKLDETLRWLYRFHQEEGTRRLRASLAALGGLVFGIVALIVAWQVVSFYLDYFNQLRDVMT